MRTIDRSLMSLPPMTLLAGLVAIDLVMVGVGWIVFGLPT